MEIGLREILMALGALAVLGILIDGLYRMFKSRSQEIKVEKNLVQSDVGDDDWDLFKNELPSGGARVARKVAQPINEADHSSLVAKKTAAIRSQVKHQYSSKESLSSIQAQPSVDTDKSKNSSLSQKQKAKQGFSNADDVLFNDKLSVGSSAEPESNAVANKEQNKKQKNDSKKNKASNLPEYIVFNLMTKAAPIQGDQLLKVLTSKGFRFGNMNIFHKTSVHVGPSMGKVLFSLANAEKPGSFDLEKMSVTETKGISLFMKVEGHPDIERAYKEILTCANELAAMFKTSIKDQNHKPYDSERLAAIYHQITKQVETV